MKAEQMHGSLGNNVKVHFAGAEYTDAAHFLHDAGVNYFLFTVLPCIKDQFGISWFTFAKPKIKPPNKILPQIAKHVIMDSGLFSLMFGACKDVRPDETFIRKYQDAIIQFVIENEAYDLTCVECDCQKLLGVDLAWELRQKFRDSVPNRIINVFHYEDGKKGLDRLIEFAEYIAISVPELRIVKPKTYKEDTYRLASYIKEKKPEIDIHLLGGTEKQMIKKCHFCTSADSTSWQQVNRYGNMGGYKKSQLKNEKVTERRDSIISKLEELGITPTEKWINYFYLTWLSGHILKREYTRYAGNQD